MAARALVAAAVVVFLVAAGCGRALPEDTPAATAPAETGAFDEPAAEEGTIKATGTGAPRDYLAAVAKGLEAEDPTVEVHVEEAEPDYAPLCAGKVEVVAATGDADEDVCGGKDQAVGFHVADAGSEPVVFYVNRDSLLNVFEVESLIQYAVDNGETLPEGAGVEPLTLDELQNTQTKLEQTVAGVG